MNIRTYLTFIFFCSFMQLCCCVKTDKSTANQNIHKNIFNKKILNSFHNNNKHKLKTIIKQFIGKSPNILYSQIGSPDYYDVVIKNKKIKFAKIIYKYIYNFNSQNYDCEIVFFTNQKQDKIVDTKISSPYCYILTTY